MADANDPAVRVSGSIERALLGSVAIELHYRDREERDTRRVVEPVGVFSTRRGWYLAAWCRLRQAPRAFKLDRIVEATITSDPIEPRSLDAVIADLPDLLIEPTLS